MSSPGFQPDSVDGRKLTQNDSDRLHFLRNRPDPPMIDGSPIEYPPYEYRPFPQAMYGPWTDETKRRALQDAARAYGLDLTKADQRAEAESRIYEFDTKLVGNDRERKDWLDKGWADEPTGVKAAQEAYHMRIATASAEVAYRDQSMSEKAKAEFLAADRANGEDPILDLPVPKPDKKPRGRPRKDQTAA